MSGGKWRIFKDAKEDAGEQWIVVEPGGCEWAYPSHSDAAAHVEFASSAQASAWVSPIGGTTNE